ncbi:hypothetical protein CVT25_005054 [Psilocybe cyanescens]|uniref:Enoyl-CoA hydratase n=1 Tax=Psilocybe cyanescens TaxID=93625 RepID=A0A409XDY6_PSICY|nr:hypothetical protein CVT25_005054 [Psilocybe cyanescens]
MSSTLSLPADNPLVTLTHPKPSLWILELHHGADNRLTQTVINKGVMPALDAVELEWRERRRTSAHENKSKDKSKNPENAGRGALIIVGRRDQDKFFSNGLNYADSLKDPNFFQLTFNPMLTRLLTFPIPTIAAINGHCFAGGFVLALACDYRVMTDGSARNAWLCMNEIHFGAPYPLSIGALLTSKFPSHTLLRKIALEGHRFTPPEALDAGIIDYVVRGKTADVVGKAEEVAERVGGNAQAGVWGLIKLNLFRKALEDIQKDIRVIYPPMDDAAARSRL